jgi:hypothetical protein
MFQPKLAAFVSFGHDGKRFAVILQAEGLPYNALRRL